MQKTFINHLSSNLIYQCLFSPKNKKNIALIIMMGTIQIIIIFAFLNFTYSEYKQAKQKIYNMQQSHTKQAHIGIHAKLLHKNTHHLQTLNINPDQVLIINHGDNLMLYSHRKNKLIKEQNLILPFSIIHATYTHRYKAIFIMLTDHRVLVYTDTLMQLVDRIDIPHFRHCLGFQYLDMYGCFVILSADTVKVIFVDINTNHLKSLFTSSIKFLLTIKQTYTLPSTYFLPFSTHLLHVPPYILMHNKNTVLIINPTHDKHFHPSQQTPNHKPQILLITNICPSPQQLSKIHYQPSTQLLVCGTNHGELIVLKINYLFLFENHEEYVSIPAQSITMFSLALHHGKEILDIGMYVSERILTLGVDEAMEVVDSGQMSVVQTFKMKKYEEVHFINKNTFLGVKAMGIDRHLHANRICLDHQLLYQHESSFLHSIYSKKKILHIMNNTSIISFSLNHQPQQSLLPPRCKFILSVVQHPFIDDQYWFLAQTSEIYKYHIGTQISVKEVKEIGIFLDMYGHEKKYSVVMLGFASEVVPVQADMDVRVKDYVKREEDVRDVCPVVLGCATGELLICEANCLEKIVCRLKYFESPITYLAPLAITSQKGATKNTMVLVYGTKQQVVASCFTNHSPPTRLYKSSLKHSVQFIALSSTFLAVLCDSNCGIISAHETGLHIYVPEQQLHEHHITHVSYNPNTHTVVSGDRKGNIVVWVVGGSVLLRFKISERTPIQCCYFDEGRLLFGYKGKIFSISKQLCTGQQSFHMSVRMGTTTALHTYIHTDDQLTKEIKSPSLPKTPKKQDISLPFINSSRAHTKQILDLSPKRRIKQHKNRNKVYQHLFHFPNKGLYSQLINRNMLL